MAWLSAVGHFAPAETCEFLSHVGRALEIDLLDYKPKLERHHGQELPGSMRMGQRSPE